ncbi:ead/Ea22-like family protein [Pseudomonas aeruginosa]|uniref:ead/Ea22-like family protein n=1 Tax=Pseudomonas aeruginosa TaxID=287 RepID=UPI0008FB9848|nr:ead/Ea22-like family protein [Pseudomonas aeruginosa]
MTDHAELRRLAKAATPGPWRVQTGCSWRRIGTDSGDGDVLRPCTHPHDGWPDIVAPAENLKYIASANPKTILALLDEIDGLSDELSACTEHPGGCGYWREAAKRRAEERDRLRAQNDALQGALHAVQAEVDGNLRPLTRDLVNMVSGLKNGSHPNDIYEHCDEIERIIGAALEGDKP